MTKPNNRGKGQMPPERLALLGKCVEDGWSYNQIRLTHRFDVKTIKRHFPDYKGMSQVEGAKLGAAYLHAFHNVNRT